MNFIDFKEFISLTEALKKTNTPFRVIRTTSLYKLLVCKMVYLCPIQEGLPINQLYFIKQTGDYIRNNTLCIPPNYKNEADIKYFDWNKNIVEGEILTNCYYIDIKNAYWTAAKHEGRIDKKIYQTGINVKKQIRLASLGTFAKKEIIFDYNGKERMRVVQQKHPHIFFNQANAINKIMEQCRQEINGYHIITWVDCIMTIDKKNADKCERIIRDAGFKVKRKRIKNIVRIEKGFLVGKRPFLTGNKLIENQLVKY